MPAVSWRSSRSGSSRARRPGSPPTRRMEPAPWMPLPRSWSPASRDRRGLDLKQVGAHSGDMTDSPHVLSSSDTAAELADSAFVHGDGELLGSYSTADFASAARLVADVGEVAERLNHHPDILF